MRLGLVCALLLAGCGTSNTTDAGRDTGIAADAGCPEIATLCMEGASDCLAPAPTCPTEGTPEPTELMGSCCWRTSNADPARHDAPELKLTYLELVAPVGSPLSSTLLRTTLNTAMQEETFTWLFRVDGADADGPVTITTGFGRRNATTGEYEFSDGMAPDNPTWCPVQLDATLTGEAVASQPLTTGSLVVPVFDEADPTMVQVELMLRQLQIVESHWSEDRSCIGWDLSRAFSYEPQGVLTAFIEVEPARDARIVVGSVMTTVCAAVAGSLNDPDGVYCDSPQSTWVTPPDSLCDATGCQANSPCMSDICDPATDCNAWHLIGHFAAAGVEIPDTSGVCP